jgi:threonine aldolase
VDIDVVETNIVLVHLENENVCDPLNFSALLREKGIFVLPFGPRTIRLVVHRDITDNNVSVLVVVLLFLNDVILNIRRLYY